MKYHINFGDEYRLSFKILDNPVAQAWASLIQENNLLEQKIRRAVLPSLSHQVVYYNDLKYYYKVLKEEYKLNLEFDLPSKEIEDFLDSDYNFLDEKIEFIYNKVIRNNYYYRNVEKDVIVKWAEFLHRLKENKNKILECYCDKDDTARISTVKSTNNKIRITDEMRKQFWVETESPKIVLRLDAEFDEKTLDLATKRNYPYIVSSNKLVSMDYISTNYKICYRSNPLNSSQSIKYMRARRDAMLDFVEKNNLKIQTGEHRHYYFVNPVVAHCLNTDISIEDIHTMFTKYSNITTEFGE